MDVLTTPQLPLADWLSVIEREYLSAFVPAGGAAVKFAILDDGAIDTAAGAPGRAGTSARHADGVGRCRTHPHPHDARAVLRHRARPAVGQPGAALSGSGCSPRHDYSWPRPGEAMAMADLAAAFAVAPNLLAHRVDQWLTADLWDDRRLAQDFRAAAVVALPVAAGGAAVGQAPDRWRNGCAARRCRPRRCARADISVRISRTNARAMLVSLCHFLRKAGVAGLLVVLDVRRLSCTEAADGHAALFAGRGDGRLRGAAGDSSTMPSICRACSWRCWPMRRWPPAIRAARWRSTRRCRCGCGPMCGRATGRTRWPRWCGSQHDAGSAHGDRGTAGRRAQPGRHPPDGHRADRHRARVRGGAGRRLGRCRAGARRNRLRRHRHGRRLRHRQVAPARLSGRGGPPAGLRGQPHRRQQGNPAVAPGACAGRRPARCGVAGSAGRPDRRVRHRAARTARGTGRDGHRRRHARCRVRADLRRLPVPGAPRVHTTRDAAPDRAPVVRRQGEHLGDPPGAGRGRGRQDVSAQGGPRRGADASSSPASCRCCSALPVMPAGVSCSTRSS